MKSAIAIFIQLIITVVGGRLMATEAVPPDGARRRFGASSDREVIANANKGSREAIHDLGLRDTPESLAALHEIIKRGGRRGDDAPKSPFGVEKGKVAERLNREREWEARFSLARRGDRLHVKEILLGLKSPDLHIRMRCIGGLGRMGEKRAAKHLAQFLQDDNRPPSDSDHVAWISFSDAAANSLGVLFPDVKAELQGKLKRKYLEGADWLDWWAANRQKYSKGLDE